MAAHQEMVGMDAVMVTRGAGPLVLDSPHSGNLYPADFEHACSLYELRSVEDTQVDGLWRPALSLGASMVAARFPRSYIDANRGAEEIDPELIDAPWPGETNASAKVKLGKGLVWRMLDNGTPIYNRKLSVAELRQRIERYWHPYHMAVAEAIDAAHARHGYVVHLNCHSMPSVAGAYSTEFPWLAHEDFVLGDRDGTTAAPQLTRWIEAFLISRGYTVSVNHPYKGVELVRKHGRPREGRHSIQVEVNKRLYMNENTLGLHAGFASVRGTLLELGRALVELDLRALGVG
jgi:N-formylglutamate deformylase